MDQNKTRSFVKLLIVFTVSLLVVTTGCDRTPVIAPDAPSQQQEIDFLGCTLDDGLSLQGNPKVEALIDSETGGTVEIPGYVSLTFPPNALDEDTKIKIQFLTAHYFVMNFSPHGEEFNEPVELKIYLDNADMEGLSLSSIDIYWMDGSSWVALGADYDAGDNAFEVDLEHFSRYALATE